MITARVDDLEMSEVWSEEDPSLRSRDAYPISWAEGTASSALVCFELEPGHHLGDHVHTAEETVLVLEGEAEVEVAGERERLAAGGLGVVPAMTSHDVRNVGQGLLRCVGFFAAAAVQTRFEQVLMPEGSRLSGTSPPEE